MTVRGYLNLQIITDPYKFHTIRVTAIEIEDKVQTVVS
jgi:hypothetical protein